MGIRKYLPLISLWTINLNPRLVLPRYFLNWRFFKKYEKCLTSCSQSIHIKKDMLVLYLHTYCFLGVILQLMSIKSKKARELWDSHSPKFHNGSVLYKLLNLLYVTNSCYLRQFSIFI